MEDNIVKATCKELGITQKELAERIGVHEATVRNVASTGNLTNQMIKTLEILIENENLKKELSNYEALKNSLKMALK